MEIDILFGILYIYIYICINNKGILIIFERYFREKQKINKEPSEFIGEIIT